MMNDMSLHLYPKGAPTGSQISIVLRLRGCVWSVSLLVFGLSWCGCRLVVCPRGLGACGLARFLLVPPPSPSPLVVCNGPVAIPLAWRVVGDWLLSSLRFMATKASALCGALPSTPCGGCWSSYFSQSLWGCRGTCPNLRNCGG